MRKLSPMSATLCSAHASSPQGWADCSCSSPIWCSLGAKHWRRPPNFPARAWSRPPMFCGLNAMPKKSFLSEYSSRITPQKVARLLALWHAQVTGDLFAGESLNLDLHAVPYFGEHPLVESHYLAKRSRRQPSILVFLAQDAESQVFCYANADIRKGEEADEIFRFIDFWKRQHGKAPQHLVFDSKLTTYAGLDRLDAAGITFLTLRRRSPKLLAEVANLPASAWRTVELDIPHRKYRNPRFYEQKARPLQRAYRQFYITELGHDEPTILLTNDHRSTVKNLITRYAKRMLIENALADAVRFFHIDALSSSVGFKVDFDMALPARKNAPQNAATRPTH